MRVEIRDFILYFDHKSILLYFQSKSGLKCRLCNKPFPTPFSLEQHLVKKHRSPSAGSGTATSPDSCSTSVTPVLTLSQAAEFDILTAGVFMSYSRLSLGPSFSRATRLASCKTMPNSQLFIE